MRDTLLTHFALDTVFAHEDPDFVAFTGDMVTGYNWDGTEGWFEKQWNKWSIKMKQRQTPYGYTLGNHDVEVCFSVFRCSDFVETRPHMFNSRLTSLVNKSFVLTRQTLLA